MLWYRILTPGFLALGLVPTVVAAQVAEGGSSGFSGIWVADPADQGFDIYGEVRLVREGADALEVAMLDFGVGWQEAARAYVGRLAIMPWTFRFGRWGSRRGPEDSAAPQARARRSGDDRVLAKRTVSGSGEFVWLWSLVDDGGELVHLETSRSWDSDFSQRPSGAEFRFRRATGGEPALSLFARAPGTVAGRPKIPATFEVRVSEDQNEILVTCPTHDCRVADFERGQEVRSRVLLMGETVRVRFGAEVHIQACRVGSTLRLQTLRGSCSL